MVPKLLSYFTASRRNSLGEAIGPLCPEHQNKMPNGKMKSQEAVGSGRYYRGIVCYEGGRRELTLDSGGILGGYGVWWF